MEGVSTQHDLQSVVSIDQVVMSFQICEIVIYRVIYECDLDLLPRAWLLQTKQVSEVIIH